MHPAPQVQDTRLRSATSMGESDLPVRSTTLGEFTPLFNPNRLRTNILHQRLELSIFRRQNRLSLEVQMHNICSGPIGFTPLAAFEQSEDTLTPKSEEPCQPRIQ